MNVLLKTLAALSIVALFAGPVFAEAIEVKMLNRGENGSMVFEPDFLALQPGDSVKFIATNKSHNAASIDGMVPDGYAGFKGKINEEIEVVFDQPGFYGIKCSPHYGMGMVMLIKVGEAELTDAIRTFEVPARSRPRFDAIFARIDAGEGASD
jgi:pseudoazurin